jgi:Ulp1 family protease
VDPLGSLQKDYYQPITNAYATNIIVGNKDSPGMESIFALQPTKWLDDAIITWWCGYWCDRTEGISNYSITRQGKRNPKKIDCERKTFFATPFFWKYIMDGNIRRANETKYIDIFTCSKMLIPVNIKLKHWILACIDFDHKRISWYDSIGETHPQESRIIFTWLKREHSFNLTTKFEPDKWNIDPGPPPETRTPLQTNSFRFRSHDCGIFVCLYAAFIDIQHPLSSLSFSLHDIHNVRVWMAHEMIEEGKLLK